MLRSNLFNLIKSEENTMIELIEKFIGALFGTTLLSAAFCLTLYNYYNQQVDAIKSAYSLYNVLSS